MRRLDNNNIHRTTCWRNLGAVLVNRSMRLACYCGGAVDRRWRRQCFAAWRRLFSMGGHRREGHGNRTGSADIMRRGGWWRYSRCVVNGGERQPSEAFYSLLYPNALVHQNLQQRRWRFSATRRTGAGMNLPGCRRSSYRGGMVHACCTKCMEECSEGHSTNIISGSSLPGRVWEENGQTLAILNNGNFGQEHGQHIWRK